MPKTSAIRNRQQLRSQELCTPKPKTHEDQYRNIKTRPKVSSNKDLCDLNLKTIGDKSMLQE